MELFSPPREKLIILQETEAPKKFLIFYKKKDFLIFRETETPKKFFTFRGNGTFQARKVKRTHSEKTSYISKN